MFKSKRDQGWLSEHEKKGDLIMENQIEIAEIQYEKNKTLSAKEVSERLRLSLSTVLYLTRIGKIEAIKVGREWRYDEREIDHCLLEGLDLRKDPSERRKSDRRRYARTSCYIQGNAIVSELNIPRWKAVGTALNISERGLFFEANEILEEDKGLRLEDPISVTLFFPGYLRRAVEVQGRVMHLDPDEAGKARVGIKFSGLSMEAFATIRDFIGQD